MDIDDDRLRGQAEDPDPAAWEARFTSTAVSDTDDLSVTIEALDGGEHRHPVRWAPNPGPTFPAAGDLAVAMEVTAEDGGRAWWVLCWVPD